MEEFWKVSWLRNNPYLFTQNDASLFCWEITLFLNLSSTFLYASKILKLTKWCLCISIKSSNLCLFVCMSDQTYQPLYLISRQRWIPKLFNESTAVSKNKFPWYFAENKNTKYNTSTCHNKPSGNTLFTSWNSTGGQNFCVRKR